MPLGNAKQIESFDDHLGEDGIPIGQEARHLEDNHVFHDRMGYIWHRNWRGNVGIWLRSETTGRRYYIFLRDFSRMMTEVTMEAGVIEADWTGVKHGSFHAIIPADLVMGHEKRRNAYEWS